jgi:hypothetical protein
LHKSLAIPCALVLAVALGLLLRPAGGRASDKTRVPEGAGLVHQIEHYRHVTWRWQKVMGHRRLIRSSASYRRDPSVRYKRWVRNLWRARAKRMKRRAQRPPYRSAWLCIHRHEGSWRDSGAPYYGGLQMDVSFQLRYGRELFRRKGTADHWTPLEQMWTAERAHREVGFTAWPNSARACGVL